jgi:hypothetical protein
VVATWTSVITIDGMTGRDALLGAFDRLFDAAAEKLEVPVSAADREEAREQFQGRFSAVLDLTGQFESPPLPTELVDEMAAQVRGISTVELAGIVAALPLARQAQDMLRSVARAHAEQKMLEHLALQADTRYGGN